MSLLSNCECGCGILKCCTHTQPAYVMGEKMEKKIRIRTNLMAGMIFVVIAAVVAVLIPSQIKMTSIVREAVDSRFIPEILCGIMGALGCWLIFKSTVLKKEDYLEISLNQEKKRAFFIIMLIVYVFLISRAGFLISSLLWGMGCLAFTKSKKVKYYIIVAVSTGVIYLIFKYLLDVSFGG